MFPDIPSKTLNGNRYFTVTLKSIKNLKNLPFRALKYKYIIGFQF